MVKVPVRHQHVANVIERNADRGNVLNEVVDKRLVRGVDEHPALAGVDEIGGNPLEAHVPDIVKDLVGLDALNRRIGEPTVERFGHAVRAGKASEGLPHRVRGPVGDVCLFGGDLRQGVGNARKAGRGAGKNEVRYKGSTLHGGRCSFLMKTSRGYNRRIVRSTSRKSTDCFISHNNGSTHRT